MRVVPLSCAWTTYQKWFLLWAYSLRNKRLRANEKEGWRRRGEKINSVSSSLLPSSLLPFVLLSLQLLHNNSSGHSRLLRRLKNLWKTINNTYTHRETGRHCSYEQSYWLSHKTREYCDGKKLCVTQSFTGLICHEIHYWTVDHREQNLPGEKKWRNDQSGCFINSTGVGRFGRMSGNTQWINVTLPDRSNASPKNSVTSYNGLSWWKELLEKYRRLDLSTNLLKKEFCT